MLATQSIRSPSNRNVIETIVKDGSIFFAYADRPWVLDGASVRVSMVGFDNGTESIKTLDGLPVEHINVSLTAESDLTVATELLENAGLSFQGSMIGGNFQIPKLLAQDWLKIANLNGLSNADVLRPYVTGSDVLRSSSDEWVIDFGVSMPLEKAAGYEMPFEYAKKYVLPERINNPRASRRERWWLHADPQPAMRKAIASIDRYIATVRVAKYRTFVWLDKTTLCSNKLIVIARADDYFFGVLHSRYHEVWSLANSSRHGIGNDPAYTPSTCFETFPFPWAPDKEPKDDPRVQAIATSAKHLDDMRNGWLHPPAAEIGVTISEKMLQKRTLTNLYNMLALYREQFKGKSRQPAAWSEAAQHIITISEIETLDHIHTTLDHAVLDAYGWSRNLSEEQILERLLALNLERAKI